jgi:hypothetical protein
MHPELVPTNDDIFADIKHVFAQGLRRPAYPADLWSEQYCLQRFRDLGLENARLEPFEVNYWEPRHWSLHAWADGQDEAEAVNVPCFPLPYTVPADGVSGCLVPFDATQPSAVAGNVALFNGHISHLPYRNFIPPAIACYDPDGTVDGYTQVLPFSTGRQETIDAIQASGASAFIASLSGYPGDSHEQFVPYRGAILPVPGVWVSGRDGARLTEMLSEGSVNVRLTLDTDIHVAETHNVLAELPGADEEFVVIGSHHDAPWASAVEDTSGLALVLAQAEYWSRVPREERPHRMLFLLHGGHMAGGAGLKAFGERHGDDLGRIVLEVHLEHAALEFVEKDGDLAPTGLPEPRWWFTSPIAHLESTVFAAVEAERLSRSIVVPPNVFGGEAPPTDAHGFFLAGVPAVSMLAAPCYLFDARDTLDKVDRENLAPITHAAIRIIESSRGQTARSMRAAMRP